VETGQFLLTSEDNFMLKLLSGLFVFALCSVSYGSDWMSYVPQQPMAVQQAPAIQYVPVYYPIIIAPAAPQLVPVTTYQNFVVERRCWTLLKRYEVVSVPQTVYVPIRY
jgi:hypothetical protein